MDWTGFFCGLFEEGRLTLPPIEPLSKRDLEELEQILLPYEAIRRAEMPRGVPPWDAAAGLWAAAMLFRACQFVVFRNLGEEALQHQLDGDPPDATPSAHYSVDLCFQYLQDVLAFARSASEGDPLVGRLMSWAGQWPLSSVGIKGVQITPERMTGIKESSPLLAVYVDRILVADDVSRLNDPTVLERLRAAIGAHDDLAPAAIARKMKELLRPDDEMPSTTDDASVR